MELFIRLSLFLFSIPSLLAFSCLSIQDQKSCELLNDCAWDGSNAKCTSTFSPSCNVPDCY